MTPLFSLYRLLSGALSPAFPFWLSARAKRGKEDPARLPERLGNPSRPRPEGALIWIHAASVGEALAVLPLITRLHGQNILLTTGTVTSAELARVRLPEGVIHQFAPLDTPTAAKRFIVHWRPATAIFVESELWPNLILEASRAGTTLILANGRMSEPSFRKWRAFPATAKALLGTFSAIYAQSEAEATRFRALGAPAESLGNLKHDAPMLPCDEAALAALKTSIAARPVWLAASTHAGEEEIAAGAHRMLAARWPNLLTLIVPRHPSRGAEIAAALGAKRRSAGDAITPDTSIYIADTLGELGLFYRAAPLVFIGGSLVPHGGQNPLEPARLGCALACGPHMFNFSEIASGLENAKALAHVNDVESLATQIAAWLEQPPLAQAMGARARAWAEAQGGATDRLIAKLQEAKSDAA